jgi:hypothetical protein
VYIIKSVLGEGDKGFGLVEQCSFGFESLPRDFPRLYSAFAVLLEESR